MKFLAIASLFASAFQMGSSVMPVFECGEGKVPCHNMGICIEPNYIEGCSSYLNQNECA